MKIIILSILAVAATFGLTLKADAGTCYRPSSSYCAPKVYKTNTCEINRCYRTSRAYDNCGRQYTYRVAVITYKDIYSNGSWRTWSKTVRV